jgi:pimeloyl-ACP methyl ester carboxylesterase
MPDVTVDGLRFHVQTLGDASTPPVVMVHGMVTGTIASWYFGLGPVVARDHYVFVYDQRGHGRSERPATGYGLSRLAADLDGLTADLGRATVVGHSFGGVVALRHAIDRPDRVGAVVLVDSFVPSSPSAGADGDRGRDDPGTAGAWGTEGWASASPPASVTTDSPRRRRRPSTEEELLGRTTLLGDLRAEPGPDGPDLAGLRVPVLCVIGSDSPFRGDVEALVDLLPADRREVHVLPGGHALHLDAPGALADLVTGFLAGVDDPVGGARRG